MNKQLTPAALVALKDALTNIYWYKRDLKSFLLTSLPTNIQIHNIDWDLTKREIISTIIDKLAQTKHTEILLKLAQDICQFNNFEHLLHIDNSEEKIRLAQNSVNHLKQFMMPYQEEKQAEELRKQRKKVAEEKRQIFKNYQEELLSLKQEFCSLATSQDNQQRGFKLENLMNRLFVLNDLDPKASFKVVGQQIDGAFTLDGTEFLFEAKWVKSPINNSDLAIFKEKIKSKLENTLGLFLSIDGFSEDGITASQSSDKVMILMDGSDLMAVLEERISFIDLINRKKQIASREGRIYVPFSQMGQ
ncbi:Uncharacterised protein [Actinobacillus porcinus]|uniref:Restriction endonuclease type IV Mrr domain-containing protein n=1 Tax=Actinobacillus porcinus TaxID=51048 RepID=A0ABY6TJE8_9PAST|nr:hypothetical protein [Actinobacillus porcinus]VFY93069.1 Uncharacterised protein [Actinobacillus porcinus]VTU07717.1 Uncharacterised protein [Actinobacillus porcinus]